MNYYKLYCEYILQVLESNIKNKVKVKNMLLREMRNVALQSCDFTTSPKEMLVTMKEQNNLGLVRTTKVEWTLGESLNNIVLLNYVITYLQENSYSLG